MSAMGLVRPLQKECDLDAKTLSAPDGKDERNLKTHESFQKDPVVLTVLRII